MAAAGTVAAAGEFELIRLIAGWLAHQGPRPALVKGIGDDCATIRLPGRQALLKVDALVEDVHFRRAWTKPWFIGWKALAVVVSDIAAAGGAPTGALVSLELPGALPVRWLREFYVGLVGCARHYGVAVAGGNLAASAHVAAHVTVGGAAPRRRIGRDGARAGDVLVVTGQLGGSRAGLEALRRGWRDEAARFAIGRHELPMPDPAAGRLLAAHATAMADVSDGLAADAGHLAAASCLKAVIVPGAVPVHAAAAALAPRLALDPAALALGSGEEYELVAAVPPGRLRAAQRGLRAQGVALTPVGEFRRGRGVELLGRSVRSVPGFDHFRRA